MVRNSLVGLASADLAAAGVAGGEAGVEAGTIAAGVGLSIIVSLGPRRKRIRSSPSRRSTSVKSCRPISATNSLIVRMSKGLGTFDGSLATRTPNTKFQEPNSKNRILRAQLQALV